MERLTIPDKKIDGGECRAVNDARKVKEHAMTIYWALKKYEDTGLTPLEIMELKERDTAKAPGEFDGHWYKCPRCGKYVGGLKGNFCHVCGQRLKWEE